MARSGRNTIFTYLPQILRIEETGLFIIFLLLSSLIWLVYSMDKYYHISLPVKVIYKNLPAARSLGMDTPDTMVISGKAKGFYLLRQWNKKSTTFITLDFANSASKKSIGSSELLAMIDAQLPAIRVEDVFPEMVLLSNESRKKAKIPLDYSSAFSFYSPYAMKSLSLEPDSITITASAAILDTILSWPLLPSATKDIKGDMKGYLMTAKSNSPNISLSHDSVQYSLKVDEMVEENLDIKIITKNVPDNVKVVIYPAKVNLTYQRLLSSSQSFTQEDFSVVADFQVADLKNGSQLPLKITRKPTGVGRTSLQPSIIDYIIYKNPQ